MSDLQSKSSLSGQLSGKLPSNSTRGPHPPRLQHSPSLPNLCDRSPPEADQDARGKEKGDQDKPPASVQDPRARHVKYASIDPAHGKPSSKTHARRRTERDVPHSLLTPPLTPSSSIRTTASSNASTSTDAQTALEMNESHEEEIADPDMDSTRILLLENVSKDIDISLLEAAIGNILANAADNKNPVGGATPTLTATRDIIKGINTRLQGEGIFPIVFFDVRQAKTAKDILNKTRFDGNLRECASDIEGVSARLINLEALFKILGHSRFLDGIEGTFSLRVHRVHHGDTDEDLTSMERDAQTGTDEATENDHPSIMRAGINVSTVQTVLKAYGSIRAFTFIQEEVDKQGVATIVYRVEYHDLRDAEASFKELNGKLVFGLMFALSGENTPELEETTEDSFHGGLSIRPAGVASNIRQPFICSVEDGAVHGGPTADLASQTLSLPIDPPSGGGSSPTYFYSTTPSDPTHLQVIRHEPPAPIHIRGPDFPHHGHASVNSVPVVPPEQQWEQDALYRAECISPCYGDSCQYCPSRGILPNIVYPSYPPYGFPPPPPLTPYPGHFPMLPTALSVVPAGPARPYEHVDHPQMHAGSWGYDPAIAALGPLPAPFFIRDDTPSGRPGSQYPVAYLHPPNALPQIQQPQLGAIPEQNHSANKYAPHRPSTPPSSSPPSHQASETAPATYRPSGLAYDNNQLNLEKIINGEEVRTTIMIKNIPNKMSDADLTAYIEKVCPRRIDFLYLRMDFKNGCNVGYAFVNFIQVQDLLHFARERLGAKWNMFSSEKVLQMSYANYQGKEALVEKFKNSAIMDERESWRPRIFYSTGPKQGLPEPFPPPTHIRRKERSSYNRGTLFPPGINSHNMQSHGILQNVTQRYQDNVHMSFHRGGGERHARGHQDEHVGESRRADRVSTFRTSTQRATR